MNHFSGQGEVKTYSDLREKERKDLQSLSTYTMAYNVKRNRVVADGN